MSENRFFSFQNKLSNIFPKYNSDFENADSLKLKISFKKIQKFKKAAHSINIKKILTLPSSEFVNTFLTTYQKRRNYLIYTGAVTTNSLLNITKSKCINYCGDVYSKF